jgi:hypothetical protein
LVFVPPVREMEARQMKRPVTDKPGQRGERGNSMVEFAIVLWFWSMLFIGTMAVGLSLTRTLQVIQTARDLGHMYAKGADFSTAGYTNLLTGGGTPPSASLVQGMVLTGSGINTVIYFTQVRHVLTTDGDCSGCANAGYDVILNRVAFGNTGLFSSVLGNPDSTDLDTHGNTKHPLTDSSDKSSQFVLIPAVGTFTGMPANAVAYVAEIYMTAPNLGIVGVSTLGLANAANYSRVVF